MIPLDGTVAVVLVAVAMLAGGFGICVLLAKGLEWLLGKLPK